MVTNIMIKKHENKKIKKNNQVLLSSFSKYVLDD